MKLLDRICDFSAALAFVFDVNWDEEYPELSPTPVIRLERCGAAVRQVPEPEIPSVHGA